jgi:hypothetical protein
MSTEDKAAAPKHPLARFWAVGMGGLAAVTALAGALQNLPKLVLDSKDLWIGEFAWDFALAAIVLGYVPFLLSHTRVRIGASIAQLVRFGRTREVVVLTILMTLVLFLGIPVLTAVRESYAIRYHSSMMDWPFLKAKIALQQRDYKVVRKELALLGKQLYYPRFQESSDTASIEGTLPAKQRKRMLAECQLRARDAQEVLRRLEVQLSRDGISFEELMLLQRAANLDPESPGIGALAARAKAKVEGAITAYVAGVRSLQSGDTAVAASELQRAEQTCRGMLHQTQLAMFARRTDKAPQNAEEASVLKFYLETPIADIERGLRTHPAVSFFLQTPSKPNRIVARQLFSRAVSDRSDTW